MDEIDSAKKRALRIVIVQPQRPLFYLYFFLNSKVFSVNICLNFISFRIVDAPRKKQAGPPGGPLSYQ